MQAKCNNRALEEDDRPEEQCDLTWRRFGLLAAVAVKVGREFCRDGLWRIAEARNAWWEKAESGIQHTTE